MKTYQQQHHEQFLVSLNEWRSITKQSQFDSISSLLIEVNNYCNQLNYEPIPDIFALSSKEWSTISSDALNSKHDVYFYGLTRIIALSINN